MKREHPDLEPNPDQTSTATHQTTAAATCGKSKMWKEEEVDEMDELLAVLGYKVKTSDMADVAQKLEQLEEAMMFNTPTAAASASASASASTNNEYNYYNILDDTVHHNPADLSTWLESMLSELNPPSIINNDCISSSSSRRATTTISSSKPFDYDLKAIPGRAVLGQPDSPPSKRSKPSSSSSSSSTRPVVLVDWQENGIRLVHLLMACAEAVSSNNFPLAETLVRQISLLSLSQAGAMGKVATYFAQALARRIFQIYHPSQTLDPTLDSTLLMHFYDACPYLKFAHFTANQAILDAFQGKTRVHVIDFSMNQGMQWPALMEALALRPGGPPSFRLTGIGPPAPDNSDHLQEVGWKLAQLAATIHVEFEYRGFVANSLADLDSEILELRPLESVAVNSVFELHKLLAHPGAIRKVLSVVKKINPDIFTVVEQEASHNGPDFMTRFTESLHYYSTMFDSLDGSASPEEEKVMSELFLGRQILNVVGCEGMDRVERHENLGEWKNRIGSSGFDPVCLGSNAFKQASMLLALFGGGEGYRVEESDGCLLLGWHTRPLIATSAWRVSGNLVG